MAVKLACMVSLRLLAALLVSVALVPVVLFLLGKGELSVLTSVGCVLLIAASVFVMFSPAGDTGAAGADGPSA